MCHSEYPDVLTTWCSTEVWQQFHFMQVQVHIWCTAAVILSCVCLVVCVWTSSVSFNSCVFNDKQTMKTFWIRRVTFSGETTRQLYDLIMNYPGLLLAKDITWYHLVSESSLCVSTAGAVYSTLTAARMFLLCWLSSSANLVFWIGIFYPRFYFNISRWDVCGRSLL